MQLRPTTKFSPVSFPKSVREWHKFWLYASMLGDSLLPFVNEPPRKLHSWAPLNLLSPNTRALADATARLMTAGLNGEHILRTWVAPRILPLRARETLMYEYTGPEHPSRVANNKLGPVEIRCLITIVTGLDPTKVPEDVILEPFSTAHPPSDVSLHLAGSIS